MAQAIPAIKFKHGNEQLPILFEDDFMQVYKSPTNEIFVENIRSGVTMRISSNPDLCGVIQFIANARVEPVLINGKNGWRIGSF